MLCVYGPPHGSPFIKVFATARGTEALWVLDRADELGAASEPTRAIFTVAIAIHCDMNQHEIAVPLEREQAVRFEVDTHFARAAARLYAELPEKTGEVTYLERRDHYVALIEGASPAIAAA